MTYHTAAENHSYIPSWVVEFKMGYLFDWTWHKNSIYYTRYGKEKAKLVHKIQKNAYGDLDTDLIESISVNDPARFLYKYPKYGIIVDNKSEIKNPVPNPLPINIQNHPEYDFLELCTLFLIKKSWLSCYWDSTDLSVKSPASFRHVVLAVYNSLIDNGSCHKDSPGTVYNHVFTLHFQQMTTSLCFNSPIEVPSSIVKDPSKIQWYDEIIDGIGTYLDAPGHWGPQQLPRLIRMLSTCPVSSKVLVANGKIPRDAIEVLIERRIVSRYSFTVK